MAGTVDSVNVATACAIALHELAATPSRAATQRDRATRRRLSLAAAALGGAALAAAALRSRRRA
jgi:hypothetical protein